MRQHSAARMAPGGRRLRGDQVGSAPDLRDLDPARLVAVAFQPAF